MSSEPIPPGSLCCRLRKLPAPRPELEYGHPAEVELENVSSATRSMVCELHPMELISFVAVDENGVHVAETNYGGLWTGRARRGLFCLEPHAKFTQRLYLLGTVPEDRRRPGRYFVRAVFRYQGIEIESEPVEIVL